MEWMINKRVSTSNKSKLSLSQLNNLVPVSRDSTIFVNLQMETMTTVHIFMVY